MRKSRIIISVILLGIGFLIWFDSSFQLILPADAASSEIFIQNLGMIFDLAISSVMIGIGAVILIKEIRSAKP